MASPVVAGTVALMLQANPNADAEPGEGDPAVHGAGLRHYDALTQGAGFLNTQGRGRARAVLQERRRPGSRYPHSWHVEQARSSGATTAQAAASQAGRQRLGREHRLGRARDDEGENIVWGTLCARRLREHRLGHRRPTSREHRLGHGRRRREHRVGHGRRRREHRVGHGRRCENIVWGTACGGDDCENIVWGTAMDLENIVWGTAADGENIVWGTNSISRTSCGARRRTREHRVGHVGDEDVTWGSSGEDAELFDDPCGATPVNYDATPLDELVPATRRRRRRRRHRRRARLAARPAAREGASNGEDAFP